jgi:hypothetical protein
MRLVKTTALIACLAAALLGGCGSSDDKGKQIPAATKAELDKQLNSINNRFDAGGGACGDIAENKDSVERTIESLPSDVDSDVKKAVTDGFNRLFQLTDEQCDENKNQQTEPETTSPTEPEPTPTEDTTPSTPTTPTTPSDTTPQGTTPKKPPKDNGDGNGNGGGGSVPESGSGGGASPGELP